MLDMLIFFFIEVPTILLLRALSGWIRWNLFEIKKIYIYGHFEVFSGQMEVMVWSVLYWNLKIHKDIREPYSTKKNRLPSSIKSAKHTPYKILLMNFLNFEVVWPLDEVKLPPIWIFSLPSYWTCKFKKDPTYLCFWQLYTKVTKVIKWL